MQLPQPSSILSALNIGAAAFARALFSIMERLLPARMKYVKMAESIDKARNVIMQYRADTIHTRTN
jgi:hypothetical protein